MQNKIWRNTLKYNFISLSHFNDYQSLLITRKPTFFLFPSWGTFDSSMHLLITAKSQILILFMEPSVAGEKYPLFFFSLLFLLLESYWKFHLFQLFSFRNHSAFSDRELFCHLLGHFNFFLFLFCDLSFKARPWGRTRKPGQNTCLFPLRSLTLIVSFQSGKLSCQLIKLSPRILPPNTEQLLTVSIESILCVVCQFYDSEKTLFLFFLLQIYLDSSEMFWRTRFNFFPCIGFPQFLTFS